MSYLQPGINDLKGRFPEVAKQWPPTKNGDLTPDTVTSKSGKTVWWQCKQGHEWQKKIAFRTEHPACPVCYHLRAQSRKQGKK